MKILKKKFQDHQLLTRFIVILQYGNNKIEQL